MKRKTLEILGTEEKTPQALISEATPHMSRLELKRALLDLLAEGRVRLTPSLSYQRSDSTD